MATCTRLYLLRHGTAVPRLENGADHPGRGITKKGRRQVRAVAGLLQRMRSVPTRVVCSPYLRTYQTARLLMRRLDLEFELEGDARLSAPADLEQAFSAVSERVGTARLLVVGHEPLLSQIAIRFIGGPEAQSSVRIDLRKGGMVELAVSGLDPTQATLLGILRPRHLA